MIGKNWAKILRDSLKSSFKNIEEVSEEDLYKTYQDWQTWLLTFLEICRKILHWLMHMILSIF